MKPIQLILAGLHSYRERQTIDFATLCEAGLFGIFGPTGSGKSTILDAITLALYGQVVRMGGSSHPQQVLNQLENSLFVSFTFELGKGIDAKRYTVEREFGIDKKGNKRQPEVRLIQRALSPEEADFVLESKATSATQAIEQLIGLTIHDFTRAVVLPQGQFSKFLTLKGSERNEMLQRIFHLQEYGEKLNDRIRKAYEENKAELHQLELELARLGEAGPEALLAATTELEAVQQQEQALRTQHQQLANQKRETEELLALQEEHQKVLGKLQVLEQEKDKIQSTQEMIRNIEASVKLWPLIERLSKLELEQSQTKSMAEELRIQREQADKASEELESTYQEAVHRLRHDEPFLIERKSKLTQALEWEQELSSMQQLLAQQTLEIQTKQSEASSLGQELERIEQQCQSWQQELTAMDERLQTLVVPADERNRAQEMMETKRSWQREKTAEAELLQELTRYKGQSDHITSQMKLLHDTWVSTGEQSKQFNANLLVLQAKPTVTEQQLEETRDVLAQVKGIGKEWRDLLQTKAEWETKHADFQQAWSVSKTNLQQCHDEWTSRQSKRDELLGRKQEAEARKLQWQQQNMAHSLRTNLREGEACPVCGSCTHPGSDQTHSRGDSDLLVKEERDIQELIAQMEWEAKEAERLVEHAKDQLHASQVQEAALKQREQSLLEEKAAIQQRLEQILQQLQQLGSGWAVSEIGQLLDQYKQVDQDVKQKITERDSVRMQLEECLERVNRLRELELQQKADYEKQAALQHQLESQIAASQEKMVQVQDQVKQLEERLLLLAGELSIDAIDQYCQAISERENESIKLQQQHKERTDQLKLVQLSYQTQKDKHIELSSMLVMMSQQLVERKARFDEKKQQWLTTTGGVPASECIEKLDQQVLQYREAVEKAERARQQAIAFKQEVHEKLVKAEEASIQLARQQGEAALALEQALGESGINEISQVEFFYQMKLSLPDYQRQVEEYQTQVTGYRYDKMKVEEKLNGRFVNQEEWEALLQTWKEIDEVWEVVKKQLILSSEQLGKIKENHERWTQLHEQRERITDEQSRLEELRKLFEAKAFVQFIAEEKMTSIARDASYHLARMTKNRYALEIGAEGEFVLRDEATGGNRRPVSTLSGGETFLTSLALALALSVEIQMRGSRLEFFFLDEGFGTLDPELLEVVLDSLERLRMDDFAIGLISHVPEMRERMPRRLVITPAEPMGAGSTIRMEIE